MAIKNSWASGEVLTAADLTDTFKGVFINSQSGTTYTLGTADSFVSISNASGGTVTIPTNATAAFNTGAVVGIMNAGTAGTFTIAGAGGVTVNTTTGGTTLLPLETVYVVKLGTNTWQTKRDPGIANAGGLVYITGSTFTTSTAVNVNNCFTSTYENYRIIVNYTAASAADPVIAFYYRAAGTDTTTNYTRVGYNNNGSTLISQSALNSNIGGLSTTNPTRAILIMDALAPQLARVSMAIFQATWVGNDGSGPQTNQGLLQQTATTQFDGFSLVPSSGNISGTLRVYGYRNS